MSLPRGRGRILNQHGRAAIVAHCPLCGTEHRYEKGEIGGEEIEAIRKRGFSDEWLPCQRDLPGNFWRVIVTANRQTGKSQSARRGKNTKSQ
jgi:hypothetical protein